MADGPKDYRDPKVTKTDDGGGAKKWLWYIIGAVVLLLLLAWILGWFDANDDMVVTDTPVIEDSEVLDETDETIVITD